jgi:RNA polymerase sigma factor (sigma-70 family)
VQRLLKKSVSSRGNKNQANELCGSSFPEEVEKMVEDPEPITHWIARLKSGDFAAAQPLWEHYFDRLVRFARAKFPAAGDEDEEDVALSAFNSFCLATARGRFPQLKDRHDLWRLLIFITAQKIADRLQRRKRHKRGGGVEPESGELIEEIVGREPTPEFAVMVAEEFQRLLDRLADPTLRQIALWKMEGNTNQEISERLGCALRTVANKLTLIRKTLQAEQLS